MGKGESLNNTANLPKLCSLRSYWVQLAKQAAAFAVIADSVRLSLQRQRLQKVLLLR